MNVKKININNKYNVVITYTNDTTRLYRLIDMDDKTITQSYNRDSFLLKARQYCKITNATECVIASI